MSFTIRRADWADEATTLLDVRVRVFVDEQGVPQALERDAHDPHALHLLACTGDGRAIAGRTSCPTHSVS